MNVSLPLSLLIGAFSGGQLKGEGDVPLPLLSTEVEATITGDLATVHATQVFANPSDRVLHARYTFPLPHDAAVHAMTMEVAGELVRGEIQRVEEAKAQFAAAKAEGKTASLLEQHRANVFTQDVANIPPGDRVTISISYAQSVPREDGKYAFHFPMAVGPRFENGANGISVEALQKPLPPNVIAEEGKAVPASLREAPRVGIRVDLVAGMSIAELTSPSHPIEVDVLGAGRRRVALGQGKVAADRDFVLEYSLAGERAAAGLVTHEDARGRFFTALIEPPASIDDDDVFPRELVFVLDASCSMGGAPIEASKRVVNRMLDHARPTDTLRVIQFGSDTDAFAKEALPATPRNIARAKRYVARVGGMGGTEMELGIKAALDPALAEGRVRQVVFLTDGYIGDEASVMATIHQHRNDRTTIFSFGVGDGVNRWLLEEMAIAGRGVARIVGTDQDPNAVADALADRLRSPILTHLSIDWGAARPRTVTPSPLPDLYAGAPLRILGRLSGDATPKTVTLVGWRHGRMVKVPLAISPAPSSPRASEAIPTLWARSQIADRMRAMTRPRAMRGQHDGTDADLVEQITQLGLDYGITTRWTAFVAVSDHRVDPSTPAVSKQVPSPSTFSSAPEPAEWAAILMLFAMAAIYLAKSRRRSVC